MTSIPQHIRHAARRLFQSPVFTLTAVASLAIGIGANTAIFTAANAIFFAPTEGVRDMGRLVDVGRTTGGRGFDTLSYATYADLRDRNTVFEGVYALELEPRPLSLGAEGGAERIYGHLVSANYFEVLGLVPAAGTFFRSEEERVGVPLRKVVLSHSLWVSRFNSQPDVVGRTLVLNGDAFTVVGVGPQGYQGSTIITPDVWLPLTAHGRGFPSEDTFRGRRSAWLILTARLKPDVTIAAAQTYANIFMSDLRQQFPEEYRDIGLTLAPASRVPGVGSEFVAPFLAVLMGVSGLVLIVTCTNLAGLFIARAAARSREVAVRLALGASRKSLVAMLMTDAILVSLAGAAAALVVAYWTAGAMVAATSAVPFPITLDLAIDWRVLGFTTGVAALTACLIGLAPAWQSVRSNLVPDLKSDAAAPRRQRLRNIFITIQLATCLVLIVMAGLFLRALGAASSTNPGFDVAGIEVATLDLSLSGQPVERAPAMAAEIRQGLAAIPGLDRVAYSRMVPLDGGGLGLGELRRPGAQGPDPDLRTDWNIVSPEFFDTIGIPIVRGRAFTAADRQGAQRVAIVNERLARTVWPNQEAIGQQLLNGDFRPGNAATIETITIVGVARDAKYRWLGEPPAPFIYVPYTQQPMREIQFLMRRAADAPANLELQTAVRQALKNYDPNLPLVRMQPLASYAELGLLPQRLAASVAGSLGVVALLLAGIGLYGVTAFAVASRTREIGVRIALGADRARVVRLVLWQGARLATIGGVIGLALALGASQLISSLLFGVSPVDPVTYALTVCALAFVTLAGTFVPARRAASVDPIRALKIE